MEKEVLLMIEVGLCAENRIDWLDPGGGLIARLDRAWRSRIIAINNHGRPLQAAISLVDG